MQRRVLLTYAKAGTIDLASRELGISAQTAKNHLTDAYRRLGVHSGPQAVYVLLGGQAAEDDLPEPVSLSWRRAYRRPLNGEMPAMVDGEVWLADLRAAAAVGDSEANGSTRASLRECVEFLSYYIRSPRGTIGTGGASGT